MNCKDCKYFNQTAAYPNHIGWCDLQLPPWLLEQLPYTDINTTVRVDDACSFFKVQP